MLFSITTVPKQRCEYIIITVARNLISKDIMKNNLSPGNKTADETLESCLLIYKFMLVK